MEWDINGIYCSKHQQRYEKTLGKPKEHDLIMVGVRFFLGGSPTSRTVLAICGPSSPLPSGNLTVCYGKSPFIVDFPIKNGDFP